MAIELPTDLIDAERLAWQQIQDGALTVTAARAVHEAVAAFAKASGKTRLAVEERLKLVVRHPEPEAG